MMKIIKKIAFAECRNLFYSPVSWFIILAFYIVSTIFIFDSFERLASALDAGKEFRSNYLGWMQGILTTIKREAVRGIFEYLHLFIILLTMGVYSREINSGSITLLFSSPVRNREIIIGKYLGIVLFNCFFLLGAIFLLITGMLLVEKSYPPEYFTIVVSLFLTTNLFAALGLFFSTITKYQIVSAVYAFIVYYLLYNVTSYGQKYDIIQELTSILSFRYKMGEITGGLISTKSIVYFISMVSLLVSFAIIQVNRVRMGTSKSKVVLRYLAVFLVFLAVNFVASRPGWIGYKDFTRSQVKTLHPHAQEVLKKLDGSPLTVTLYINLFQKVGPFGFPEGKLMIYKMGFWDDYLRFYPNINFEYVYYYAIPEGDLSLFNQYPGKSIEEIVAFKCQIYGYPTKLFVPGDSLDNFNDLEEKDFRAVMKLDYKDRSIYLHTGNGNSFPTPTNVAGQLMRLVRDEDVTVTFLTGNLERSPFRKTPRDFGKYTGETFEMSALVERGVDVDTLSIKDKDIPDDVQLLVVADPRLPYTTEELARIERYIEKGGNALFFTEPGKQFILNPILQQMGITAEDGILTHNAPSNAQLIGGRLTDKALGMSIEMERFLLMPGLGNGLRHIDAVPLSFETKNGFEPEPVIQVDNQNIWLEKGHFVKDSLPPDFNPEQGDVKMGIYTLGVVLRRKIGDKEQRILVAGDADFMSNRLIDDKKLNHHFYSWGLNNLYPIYCYYPFDEDRFLHLDRDGWENLRLLYLFVIPTVVFFIAYGFLARRRKK